METAFVVAALVAFPLAMFFLFQAVLVSRIDTTVLHNNDSLAKEAFLALLSEAEREMIVYDDGDDDPKSIYNDAEVINRIDETLRQRPALELKCVFNIQDRTTFREKFSGHPRVSIRARRINQRRVHYKIVDGRKAYISCHELGSRERTGKLIDLSNTRMIGRGLIFRPYVEDFRKYAA